MKFARKSVVAISLVIGAFGLPACTTVDLSQVVTNQQARVKPSTPTVNIVEKTSSALTAICRKKGWSGAKTEKPTQSAASVLLNGMKTETPQYSAIQSVSSQKLLGDILQVNIRVEQATKAAEVFLVTADMTQILNDELSQLEVALLTVKQAHGQLGKRITLDSNSELTNAFTTLETSISALRKVTDDYGIRIRNKIAQAAMSHS
ncbi:MAG: hypothetical protein V3U57_08255 [Robiginitomaculum sp.]